MARRFTDSKKWRNEWFRTLGAQAKLTWVYLCDECDKAGVIQIDYGLASFQLGFKITEKVLSDWFGAKIYFFDGDRILIRQFFEFQYGTSKDTWSAKIEARKQLEALGFHIVDGKVIMPSEEENQTTIDPLSVECDNTPLIRVRGRVSNCIKEEKRKFDFDFLYQAYPKKEGKQKGLEICKREIKTIGDYEALHSAINRYSAHLAQNGTAGKYIKQFSSFMASWRDWVEPDAGKAADFSKPKLDLSRIKFTGADGEKP